MLNIFIYSVLAYGMTNIIVFGSIFQGIRSFWTSVSPKLIGKLFTCPMCLSTWVGFTLSMFMMTHGLTTPIMMLGFKEPLIIIFLDGIFTSGIVWLIHTFQEKMER